MVPLVISENVPEDGEFGIFIYFWNFDIFGRECNGDSVYCDGEEMEKVLPLLVELLLIFCTF